MKTMAAQMSTKCPKCKGTGNQTKWIDIAIGSNSTVTRMTNEDCSLCEGMMFVKDLVAFEYNLKVEK